MRFSCFFTFCGAHRHTRRVCTRNRLSRQIDTISTMARGQGIPPRNELGGEEGGEELHNIGGLKERRTERNISEDDDEEPEGIVGSIMTFIHSSCRFASVFVIASVVVFALVGALKPKHDAFGEFVVRTTPPAVVPTPPVVITIPAIRVRTSTPRPTATPAAQIVSESPVATFPVVPKETKATRGPTATPLSITPTPTTKTEVRRKGWPTDPMFAATLPVAGDLQLSNDSFVAARGKKFDALYPCAALPFVANRSLRSDGSPTADGDPSVAPFAYFPIGCFGEPVPVSRDAGPRCSSLTCRIGGHLAAAARCGAERFGSFLGDNFYPSGLKSARDPRFNELWTKFWWRPELQFPYYSCVGNHDAPRPHAQIRTDHPYFKMPAFNHASPVILGPDGRTTVQIFMVDTHWGYDANTPHMAAQATWLDAALSESTAQWKIVASHEPVWCFLGFMHSRGLVEHIHPVLVRRNVQLFVAAHAHGISFHRAKGGYHQLTSAGFAANVHDAVRPNRPAGYYHLGTGGAVVYFYSDRMEVVAMDANGNVAFAHAVPFGTGALPGEGGAEVAMSDTTVPGVWSEGDAWTIRAPCDAWLPSVPSFCRK